ncbi:hypothetical protein BC938DRAFT_483794 [Jimgerdemannia flammicorona]|uniref:Uncharacterized protein n=1 Tax=Jimgerdemannia flammicorona TaxID=994334 RepID=A0A433QVR7_9FUNG|nr:hypothetical protein BC938DRAFT_483794 [Jimgerdemannia flammicorona]
MATFTPFTQDELLAYFDRINYSQRDPSPSGLPAPTIENLCQLIVNHQQAIPFENLTIHYSSNHTIDIEPQALYNKIVLNRRGGYCFENNGLFARVLRSLGYKLWTGAASVVLEAKVEVQDGQPTIKAPPMTHQITIVQLPTTAQDGGDSEDRQDALWLVDVGFGGQTLPAPKMLVEHEITPGVRPEQFRFTRVHLASNVRQENPPYWLLEYRYKPDSPWMSAVVFDLTERSHADYYVANQYMSTNPESKFVKNVMMARLRRDEDGVLTRVLLLNDILKLRRDGETKLIQQFEREHERVKAIEEWFGIKLSEEDIGGMKGRSVALME